MLSRWIFIAALFAWGHYAPRISTAPCFANEKQRQFHFCFLRTRNSFSGIIKSASILWGSFRKTASSWGVICCPRIPLYYTPAIHGIFFLSLETPCFSCLELIIVPKHLFMGAAVGKLPCAGYFYQNFRAELFLPFSVFLLFCFMDFISMLLKLMFTAFSNACWTSKASCTLYIFFYP